MQSVLEKNMPGQSNWEGSFYERLIEYGEWDAKAFWELHLNLLNIANRQDPHLQVDRELAYMLLYIQQRILNLISAHFDNNDVFKISNLSSEQVYEFKERFEMAILSAISGEVLAESSFDLVNPLVKNA